jgi:hypothetical protein
MKINREEAAALLCVAIQKEVSVICFEHLPCRLCPLNPKCKANPDIVRDVAARAYDEIEAMIKESRKNEKRD